MRALLVEEVLKQDKFEFEVDYNVDSTEHSEQRKNRVDNQGRPITDEEITQSIEAAMDEITHGLMFDIIRIGEKVAIKNSTTFLNIIAQLQGKEQANTIIFKIITVMRKENFWVDRSAHHVIKI